MELLGGCPMVPPLWLPVETAVHLVLVIVVVVVVVLVETVEKARTPERRGRRHIVVRIGERTKR